MFWPDVIALKEFYASQLGQIVCLAIKKNLRKWWPTVRDENILGLGFTPPYLSSLTGEAHVVTACMPAAQGVVHWPLHQSNLSLLSDEAELPFSDNSMQRILIAHALENSENARQMMSEVWRVLAPAGRVVLVVPNRRGMWARSPQSPFAYGQPFTSWQLRQLLFEHSLTPLRHTSSLFFPPSVKRYILRSAKAWEGIGQRFFSGFGGVIMVEAEKQIYSPLSIKVRNRNAYKPYKAVAKPIGI